ncbi:Protein rds1 [Hypsizygus marmoreus]|uniref:Protein rds1 n=1 Tax=Hypsizygus marmoreus TaxID=39966 RepID=A0A369J8D3_HYPMA|nr:Protein rds1 [Hypsizygus marmoreus]
MKFTTVISTLSVVSLPALASVTPVKRAASSDVEILNFALTLEHLEVAFYSGGLSKFSQSAFRSSGFSAEDRNRYEQILEHEQTHVTFLTNAIKAAGGRPVKPCTYSFPYKNVEQWVDISYTLESVGTSAYNGAIGAFKSKSYATRAGSIMGVEARQSAWINSAVRGENPWNTAFETPLDMNQAFTLAKPFIVKCPTSNVRLPVKANPPLTVGKAVGGNNVALTFSVPRGVGSKPLFAAWLTGTGTVFTRITNKQTKVPRGLLGFVYVIITTSGNVVTDANTVAGPAVVTFPFN